MNIFLIGYRCTGKTSVGTCLADHLGWQFADADEKVVAETQTSISELVAKHGWTFFREKEQDVINRLCCLDKYVISTGGGVILNPENVSRMKKSGTIVWLRASPETIRQRIMEDRKTSEQRPALTTKGLIQEIGETLSNRTPLYEHASDFFIDTDDEAIAYICQAVISKLNI